VIEDHLGQDSGQERKIDDPVHHPLLPRPLLAQSSSAAYIPPS
jgi:hypothetical protein